MEHFSKRIPTAYVAYTYTENEIFSNIFYIENVFSEKQFDN